MIGSKIKKSATQGQKEDFSSLDNQNDLASSALDEPQPNTNSPTRRDNSPNKLSQSKTIQENSEENFPIGTDRKRVSYFSYNRNRSSKFSNEDDEEDIEAFMKRKSISSKNVNAKPNEDNSNRSSNLAAEEKKNNDPNLAGKTTNSSAANLPSEDLNNQKITPGNQGKNFESENTIQNNSDPRNEANKNNNPSSSQTGESTEKNTNNNEVEHPNPASSSIEDSDKGSQLSKFNKGENNNEGTALENSNIQPNNASEKENRALAEKNNQNPQSKETNSRDIENNDSENSEKTALQNNDPNNKKANTLSTSDPKKNNLSDHKAVKEKTAGHNSNDMDPNGSGSKDAMARNSINNEEDEKMENDKGNKNSENNSKVEDLKNNDKDENPGNNTNTGGSKNTATSKDKDPENNAKNESNTNSEDSRNADELQQNTRDSANNSIEQQKQNELEKKILENKAAAEQQKKDELEKKNLEKEAADQKKKDELEKKKLEKEEADQKKKDELEKKRLEKEAAEQKKKDELEKKRLEKEAAEQKKKDELEKKRLEKEAADQKKKDELEKKKKEQEDAAEQKKKQEKEAAEQQKKDELEKKRLEKEAAEQKKKDELEKKRLEKEAADQKKKDELEKKRLEKEAADQKKKDELEKKKKEQEEADQKRRDELEKKKLEKEAADQKKKDELEKKKLEKEEADQKKKDELEKKKQEQEANNPSKKLTEKELKIKQAKERLENLKKNPQSFANSSQPTVNDSKLLKIPINYKDQMDLDWDKFHAKLNPVTDSIEYMKKNQMKFWDSMFPPDKSSLFKNISKTTKPKWKTYKWIRISEIPMYKKLQKKIFQDISPNDIQQGALGNCYFLSSLSSLAETPFRIERLFGWTQSYNEEGIYYVYLCINGFWKYIMIDDYIPCTEDGEPAFAKPKISNNIVELWVLLLEKAYAKAYGNYETIEAGFLDEALKELTGMPCKNVYSDPSIFGDSVNFEKLLLSAKENYVICANCGADDISKEKFKKLNLIPDHAYSLIDVKRLEDAKKQPVELVCLRNPWGEHEWTGDWSDSSELWTPDLKKQLGENLKSNDGAFWMSFKDFKEYFFQATICCYQNQRVFSSVELKQVAGHAGMSSLNFEIKEKMRVYLSLTQIDRRLKGNAATKKNVSTASEEDAPEDEDSYDYLYGTNIVVKLCQKISAGEVKEKEKLADLVAAKYELRRDITLKLDLEPGWYTMLGMFLTKNDGSNRVLRFWVTAIAPTKIDLKQEATLRSNLTAEQKLRMKEKHVEASSECPYYTSKQLRALLRKHIHDNSIKSQRITVESNFNIKCKVHDMLSQCGIQFYMIHSKEEKEINVKGELNCMIRDEHGQTEKISGHPHHAFNGTKFELKIPPKGFKILGVSFANHQLALEKSEKPINVTIKA